MYNALRPFAQPLDRFPYGLYPVCLLPPGTRADFGDIQEADMAVMGFEQGPCGRVFHRQAGAVIRIEEGTGQLGRFDLILLNQPIQKFLLILKIVPIAAWSAFAFSPKGDLRLLFLFRQFYLIPNPTVLRRVLRPVRVGCVCGIINPAIVRQIRDLSSYTEKKMDFGMKNR